MSMLKAANDLNAGLIQTLYEGQKAMTDLALKQTAVNMQAQLSLQQSQTAMEAVAMMTGIGTKVDTVV